MKIETVISDIPIAEVPLAPVDERPTFSAEQQEAFSAHVQKIREQGDALNITPFKQRILGAKSLASAAVIVPAVAVAATPGAAVVEGTIALAVSGAVAYDKYARRDTNRSTARMNGPAQKLLGERY